jgi:hypothetical protein
VTNSIVAAILLGTLQTGNLDCSRPITLEYRAGKLSGLARILAQESGVHLEVSGELSNACIAVRVNSTSLTDILRDLARVLESEWKQEADRLVLRRSAVVRDKLAEDFRLIHKARVRDALSKVNRGALGLSDAYRRALASMEAFQEALAGLRRPDSSGGFEIGDPSELLLKELLVLLRVEALANIPTHRVVVFSDNPTNGQSQLPVGYNAALRTYRETCEALVSVAGGMEMSNPHLAARWQKIIEGARTIDRIGKVLLFCANRGDSLWGLIAVYSTEGKLLTRSATFLPLQSTSASVIVDDRFSSPIELSDDSKKLLSLWSDYYDHSTTKEPSLNVDASVKAIVLNPEIHDPLAYAVTDALFAAAGKDNLMAYIPDELLNICRTVKRGDTLDSRAFWTAVMSAGIINVIEAEGKLLIAPKNPVECETARIPREVLGKALRASAAAGHFSVETLARLINQGGDAVTWESVEPYRAHLIGLGVDRPSCVLKPDLYRATLELLGSLSDTQLAWLRSGRALDSRSFSEKQLYFLSQWATQHATVLERTDDGKDLPDILLTGTEAMPNGPPPNTILSLSLSQGQVVTPAKSLSEQWPDWLPQGASDLAHWVARTLSVNPGISVASLLNSEWRLGNQERMKLTVSITNRIQLSCEWPGPTTYGSKSLSYSELPKSFREAVDADLERLGIKR